MLFPVCCLSAPVPDATVTSGTRGTWHGPMIHPAPRRAKTERTLPYEYEVGVNSYTFGEKVSSGEGRQVK